jgi:cell filamentation protein
LLIHPFREGNGRLARWLADLMALQAGLPAPRYMFAGRGGKARRTRYLEAVTKGYFQDYEPLAGFFLEAFGRSLQGDL